MVAVNRPRRGARLSSFYPTVENPSLSDLDSAFQLEEYISMLIRKNPHDVDTIVAIPNRGGQSQSDEGEEGKNEVVVDEHCWVYEQLRCVDFFVILFVLWVYIFLKKNHVHPRINKDFTYNEKISL